MARQAPPQSRQKRFPVAAGEDNRWSSPPLCRALLSHLGNKCHSLLQQPLSHGGGRMTRWCLRGIPTPPPLSPNAIRTLEERPLRQGESGHDPAALVPALRSKAVDGECTARIDDYGRKNAPRSEGDQGQPAIYPQPCGLMITGRLTREGMGAGSLVDQGPAQGRERSKQFRFPKRAQDGRKKERAGTLRQGRYPF